MSGDNGDGKSDNEKGRSDNGKVITGLVAITSNMEKVLLGVASGKQGPKTIAKFLDKKRGNVHRTLQKLMGKGLVAQEKGTKLYFLTTPGMEVSLSLTHEKVITKATEKVITKTSKGGRSDNEEYRNLVPKRGHNIRAKFLIKSAPKGWLENPKEFFTLQKVSFQDLGLKNVHGVQFVLDDFLVKATSRSVVLLLKVPITEEVSASVIKEFLLLALDAGSKLEKMFIELVLCGRPVISVGELAHENDLVARLKEAEGENFKVIRHSDGKARIQFDGSKGPIEVEFLHPGMFDHDSETWERRIPQLLDSPYDYDVMGRMLEQEEFRNDEQDVDLDSLKGVARDLADAHVRSEKTLTLGLKSVLRAVEMNTKQHTALMKMLMPKEPEVVENGPEGRPDYLG